MSDRPIIFSAPMVLALLDGRKTQTRRLLSPRPELAMPTRVQHTGTHVGTGRAEWEAWDSAGPCNAFREGKEAATCIFHTAALGDRLYVREAWSHSGGGVFEIKQARMLGRGGVIYRADDDPRFPHAKYWPSIHMPREFSRLTLIVEAMKVERLQEISEEDALAEGIDRIQYPEIGEWGWPQSKYRDLWNSLHGVDSWDANPWVVALTFWVVRGNIDGVAG